MFAALLRTWCFFAQIQDRARLASIGLAKIDDCEFFFDHVTFSQTSDFNEADKSSTQANFTPWVWHPQRQFFDRFKLCAFTDP